VPCKRGREAALEIGAAIRGALDLRLIRARHHPPGLTVPYRVANYPMQTRHKRGIVGAAEGEGVDPSLPQGGFPASLPGIIAVADEPLQSLPARVYIAPGRDVPTTQPGREMIPGQWQFLRGRACQRADRADAPVRRSRDPHHAGPHGGRRDRCLRDLGRDIAGL